MEGEFALDASLIFVLESIMLKPTRYINLTSLLNIRYKKIGGLIVQSIKVVNCGDDIIRDDFSRQV